LLCVAALVHLAGGTKISAERLQLRRAQAAAASPKSREYVTTAEPTAAPAPHRVNLWEKYIMNGPCMKPQDISDPIILRQVLKRATISFAVVGLLSLLSVYCFDPRKITPLPPSGKVRDPQEEWRVGPMCIFEDKRILLWSVSFPCVRWSQTCEATQFMSFWTAFLVSNSFGFVRFFFFWVFTYTALFDLAGPVVLWHRRWLRRKIGLPNGALTWVGDVILSLFWSINVIAHEARVAKAIVHSGRSAEGSNQYTIKSLVFSAGSEGAGNQNAIKSRA